MWRITCSRTREMLPGVAEQKMDYCLWYADLSPTCSRGPNYELMDQQKPANLVLQNDLFNKLKNS
jgi:hypothetical protein